MPNFFRQIPRLSLWHLTAALMTVIATSWAVVTFGPEIRRLRALEAQAESLAEEELRLESRLSELRRRQQWLETDSVYVEAVARDRLNLYRPGETIFRIPRETETP